MRTPARAPSRRPKRRPAARPVGRQSLGDRVGESVRDMIVRGVLPAGERVNEVHLAEALGVSRTPVREALRRLCADGTLEFHTNRGFRVLPLTTDEFEQLYAVRPLIEPEALRLAGPPSAQRLEELERLNARLWQETRAEAAISLDDRWHRLLIDACPNRVLLRFLDEAIARTRRYELALLREAGQRRRAVDEHAAILAALRRRDLHAACDALRRNLQSGAQPILNWLQGRDAAKKEA